MSLIAPDKRIIAVLPAYNAEKTLRQTVRDIPGNWIDEIILVDDASQDSTVQVARELGLRVFVHDKNLGYGGNQKTCYTEALRLGADFVVMVHPDHQYDPHLVPRLLTPLIHEEDCFDAVFGSRLMTPGEALKGGMPGWKYLANKALTLIANMVLGLRLSEYHSGFRAYTRKALTSIPWRENSDDFVFDTEIIIQLRLAGLKILEMPIHTRYFPEASMIGFKRSVVYGFAILFNLWQYFLFIKGFKNYKKFELK